MNPLKNICDYPPIEDVLQTIWDITRNVTIDANKVSRELGSVKTANIVVLGAAASYLGIKYESLENAIKLIFGKKGDEIVEMNLRALKAGKDYSVART